MRVYRYSHAGLSLGASDVIVFPGHAVCADGARHWGSAERLPCCCPSTGLSVCKLGFL